MRPTLYSSVLAAGLLSSSVTHVAFDTFMEFKGGTAPATEGESTTQGFEAQVEIYSFSWGLSNPVTFQTGGGAGAGKVSISSFNFMKKMDKSSPSLFTTCASGKHYDEVVVKMRKAGGTGSQSVFLIYTFNDVFVESQQWSGSSGGDDTPTESVSIAFAKVKMEYTPPAKDGVVQKPLEAGWDILANKE